MLDNYREYLPNTFLIPDYLLSIGGKVEGATIPKLDGTPLSVLLNDKKADTFLCIFYLKKIGEILNQLKFIRNQTPLNDFYINDLNSSNFIVNKNNGELSTLYLDSSKIAENKNFPARFLTSKALLNNVKGKYKFNEDKSNNCLAHVLADENTDLYCYIITR